MAFEKVADLDMVPDGAPLRVDVEGVPVCLVRSGEQIRAVHDTCSHQEWSLAEGMVWGNAIECDLHGSTFDLDSGRPQSLPATVAIPTFPVEIDGDAVLVDVEHPLNDAPFPEH